MNALAKNGITRDDLKRSHDEGYKLGVESAVATCYAGFCLALKAREFSQDDIVQTLKAADEKIVFTLDTWELIDEVFESVGIQLDFKSPERVQEV